MSRNSSGRSSYSYKSQEDFQDEILDLKRQLAKLKEESRTIKVKLRRSEENATRKEKIICNMIDPLKAHLSAKSIKCQKKGSQKKETQNPNRSSSLAKVYHHSTCSRAYRHSAKPYELSTSDHSTICMDELPRSDRKKKCSSKVTTEIESMLESHIDLPKAVLSVRPLAVQICRGENCSSPANASSGEVSNRPVNNISKNQEGDSISPVKMANSQKGKVNKKNIKGKTKKKKSVTEKNARSLLFQLCGSSENEEDNYSSYVAMEPSKTIQNVRAKHSAALATDEVPHNSDNCKRCHSKCLKSVDYVNDNTVTHKIENLIKGGKNLLSMWDEDSGCNMKHLGTQGNFKSVGVERNTGDHTSSKECGSNKFGMYLINEHDEVEDSGCVDIIVAEDESETLESWREVESKISPSCLIERRASIFRVDIKKKDPNTGDEYIEDVSSQKASNEMIYRSCCEVSKESGFYAAGSGQLGMRQVPVDAECQVMEHLLETLSVADNIARNNIEMVEPKRGKCLRNTLENLLAATESDECVRKPVENKNEFQQRTNMEDLCLRNSKCFPRCLTGVISREFKSMCPHVNCRPLHREFASQPDFGMEFQDNVPLLGIINLPCETLTSVSAFHENI